MMEQGVWRLGRWPSAFSEIMNLQNEMNRLFADVYHPYREEFPQVNIWAGDKDTLVIAELPGIDPQTLDISVHNDAITLSGSRPAEPLKEGGTYQRQERRQGRFSRTFQLPFKADAAQAEAKYERGILTVKLARAETDKPKKISIKSELRRCLICS